MPSTVERLLKKGLITPPSWLPTNVHYETIVGSVAYGVSTDASDFDTVGFCVPPKDLVFPHLAGRIQGFGRQQKKFICYQKHGVYVAEELVGAGRTYDLNVYNIVHYFNLCMENNPNMIDSLFTPQECVLHSTKVANMVRDKRRMFLHKGAWHRFKGYAYNQLHKMKTKTPEPGSKRWDSVQKYGYDVKFAYHVVRLLYEVEQILTERNIDIRRNAPHLKAIRNGEVSEKDLVTWASNKEKALEKVYFTSALPHSPDEPAIKRLLFECLEEHYGSLKDAVVLEDSASLALREIAEIVDRSRTLLG